MRRLWAARALLVPLDRVWNEQDKTLYTTSLVIAQGVGNDHGSVI